MTPLQILKRLRQTSGDATTNGLSDEIIEQFLKHDEQLEKAISMADDEYLHLHKEFPGLLEKSEKEQIQELQSKYVNFYSDDTINPYVALAAHGPWIITTRGAVIYDAGGYGMLGMGHSPEFVLDIMSRPHVMANIMTASFSQKRFSDRLEREIGFKRSGSKRHPFAKYICINSGSEAVSVASRISDINAAKLTAPGAKHAGKTLKFLSFKGSFHGRTDRPAQVSDSSLPKYREHLASFKNRNNLITIEPNNIGALEDAFATAKKENIFIEAFFIEPVMGEGNPGQPLEPSFFKAARKLCDEEGTLLICDSIQASLRAQGCLSVVDYPGFEDLDPPDMETYSKALNAGQYPLSVLALRDSAAKLYAKGVYGNTMTTNPRALDVGAAVLDHITPEIRKNIVERGKEFVDKLKALQKECPHAIEGVKGTGLLVAASMTSSYQVVGVNCLEDKMRRLGIGVIHGGKNALRFTPHFRMTSAEIDLVISVLRDLIKK